MTDFVFLGPYEDNSAAYVQDHTDLKPRCEYVYYAFYVLIVRAPSLGIEVFLFSSRHPQDQTRHHRDVYGPRLITSVIET